MTLYLLKYNNYYNRIIKRETSIDDYLDYVIHTLPSANFHSADGVNTSHIVGGPTQYDGSADYLIAYDNGAIQSRWFIIENSKTRGGQYEIMLHRDLIADYYVETVSAPCFIEKATVDNDNPLILNSEDMAFNQVKTKETRLMDTTSVPWIIGYFNKDFVNEEKIFKVPVETVQSYTAYPTLEDVPYINDIRNGKFVGKVYEANFQLRTFYGPIGWRTQHFQDRTYTVEYTTNDYADDFRMMQNPAAAQGELSKENMYSWQTYFNKITNAIYNYYDSSESFKNQIRGIVGGKSQAEVNNFLNSVPTSGKVIRTGSASQDYKYYKITRTGSTTWTRTDAIEPGTALYNEMLSATDNYVRVLEDTSKNFAYQIKYTTYSLTIQELPGPKSYSVNIPANDRRTRLTDAPYDMFAIPYGGVVLQRTVGPDGTGDAQNIVLDPDVCMRVANAIAEEMGGIGNNILFDLQLLPYCPISSCKTTYGQIDISDLRSQKDYTWIALDGAVTGGVDGIVFYPDKSDFSDTIFKIDPRDAVGFPQSVAIEVTEPKIESQCDTYRLVSPNYNGQFEFNAAKNGGVQYYEIDCTYKPFSPYIHVCPNFGKLYGKDFNDARGLVCGGDFSLPTITDQWISYEINNKNYLNTFNRQIENMEINNKYQRRREEISAITGAISAGVNTGTTAGLLGSSVNAGVGAGAGLIAGAIAGGVSYAAAKQDIRINDILRNEAIDYTMDQFGYELGNIRALPYSLNRVSAFNINNKVFPIVEYYTCTDVEKQALRDKIKYNGMSIGVIGNIASYIRDEKSYIKGKLIRIESDRVDDYHIVSAIAEEINKGVFI